MKQWLFHTPLRDLIQARPGRLAWRAQVEASSLETDAKVLVLDVVSRTRLRRHEQADVAEELIAHFEDAADAGDEQAIKRFGDRLTGARMIGIATRRKRSLADRMVTVGGVALAAAAVACLAVFVLFFARGGIPDSAYAYLEARPPAALVSLYAPAIEALRQEHPELFRAVPEAQREAQIEQLLETLSRNPLLLDDIRELTRHPVSVGSDPLFGAISWLSSGALDFSYHILARDLQASLGQGEIKRAIADIAAVDRMINQMRNSGPYGQYSAVRVLSDFLRKAGGYIHPHIQSLDRRDLIEIAHALPTTDWNYQIDDTQTLAQAILDGSGAYSRDFLGLTPRGYKQLIGWKATEVLDLFRGPLTMVSERPGKQQISALVQIAQAINQNQSVPYWRRQDDVEERVIDRLRAEGGFNVALKLRHNLWDPGDAIDLARLYRDGIGIGIAVELFARDHGVGPQSIEALIPNYLPRMPVDQYTGNPLAFDPVSRKVYSLGPNGHDDGGIPSEPYIFDRALALGGPDDLVLWP